MERLTDLKCGDCAHCRLGGWWTREHLCDVSGMPVDKDDGACISVLPKAKLKKDSGR